MVANVHSHSFWDSKVIAKSLINSIVKLSPLQQVRNPIMFTAYMGAIVITGLLAHSFFRTPDDDPYFILAISLGLWATLLLANFAESLAEERGKTQAQNLRKVKNEVLAKKLSTPSRNAEITLVPSSELRANDLVLVEANDFIPSDGDVIEGIASVNESAVTGESAPVIRESGGDNNSVTGGTQIISDWLVIRITSDPGETFLDHMIHLVEGTKRKKTPNELALTIFLTSLTLVFLLVCATLLPFSIYTASSNANATVVSITAVIALFVCLAPTTIGGLLSAIGIAGMDRMLQANIIVLSPNIVETAGDIDTLILDKTGTVTLGNRHATEFIPATNVSLELLAEAAQLASLADETPEGRSIVMLAREKYGIRVREILELGATFIPFTAQTRMSGANLDGRQIRKGSALAIEHYVRQREGVYPDSIQKSVDSISRKGGTALVVAEDKMVLGVIHLKDIIKPGIRARFSKLRSMGIKTIMVTGDNQLTTAAIAAEAGVDDFLAEAYPEDKLKLIRKLQAEGRLVAMTGDGANDSPALAQADVALAMNSGTQAAKEAGNLVDLDSNPTKLIEVIEIGKQLLITRGALTTFSLANDLSKNLAILPAAFASAYPALAVFDVMHLATPHSAILSTVIFNAVLIAVLIPLALHGIKYRSRSAAQLLRRNMLIYGLGGLIVPFVGIKLIDLVLIMLDLT